MDEKIKQLENQLITVQGKEQIDILNQLCENYLNSSPEKSLEFSLKAFELSQNFDDKSKMVASLYNVGSSYMGLSDYNKARKIYQESITLCYETHNIVGVGNALNRLGNIHWYLGEYQKALEYYMRSLKIREDIGDEENIYRSYNNIGMIHWVQRNYDKALEYYEKCLEKAEVLNKMAMIANPINNIGLVYTNLGNYGKALEYFLKALEMYKELEYQSYTANSYSNIAEAYDRLGEIDMALEYYLNALEIKEQISDKWGYAQISNKIGEVYVRLNNFDEGTKFLNKAGKLAAEIGAKGLIKDNYLYLSELYSTKGDFKQALEHYKEYSKLKDSIFSAEMSDRIAELQNKYQTEKKEKELAELKVRFINMASHEFRTPLTVIFGTMQAFTLCYEKMSEDKRTEKINHVRRAISYMTKLLDDILIVGKMYMGNLESKCSNINLKKFCNDIIEDFNITNKKNQNLIFKSDVLDFTISIDEMLLRKIVTNLLSNAEKYSPNKASIQLDIRLPEQDILFIRIKDDGIGIPDDDQKYIFEPFHLGENALMNQGMGMGLAIVSRAIQALKGEITFDSKLGKGTEFQVKIPIKRVENS